MAGFNFRTDDALGALTTGAKILSVFTNHASGGVSADLAFRLNNSGLISEVMRMTSNGNVGIGTSSPSSALSVAGSGFFNGNLTASNLTATGTLAVSGTATSTFGTGGFTIGTNQFVVQTGNGFVGIGTSTPSAVLGIQGTSTAPTTNLLSVASSTGASLFAILSNGNVGIGTSTPARHLDIANSDGLSQILLEDTTAAAGFHYGGIKFQSGDFSISTLSDALTLTSRFLIASTTGNVGIGSSSPSALLSLLVPNASGNGTSANTALTVMGGTGSSGTNGASTNPGGTGSGIYFTTGIGGTGGSGLGGGSPTIGSTGGIAGGFTITLSQSGTGGQGGSGISSSAGGVGGAGSAFTVLGSTGGNGGVGGSAGSGASNGGNGGTGGAISLTAGNGGTGGAIGAGSGSPHQGNGGAGANITIQSGLGGTGYVNGANGVLTLNANGGNVGIGTTTPLSTLTVTGSGCFSKGAGATLNCGTTAGSIYYNVANTNTYDMAEDYIASDLSIGAGDIVAFNPSNPLHIVRAGGSLRPTGVISTDPGVILGGADVNMQGSSTRPVALSGRIPTKVNLEGGYIAIGDSIALSSVPGVGKKASGNGDIIGTALEAYTGNGNGLINVFVNLRQNIDLNQLSFDATTTTQSLTDLTSSLNDLSASLSVANASLSTIGAHVDALSSTTAMLQASLASSALASTTASSLATDQSFIQTIASAVRDLIQSAGNWAVNRITSALGVFNKVQTKELCVDDTCITADQLKQILKNENVTAAAVPADITAIEATTSNATSTAVSFQAPSAIEATSSSPTATTTEIDSSASTTPIITNADSTASPTPSATIDNGSTASSSAGVSGSGTGSCSSDVRAGFSAAGICFRQARAFKQRFVSVSSRFVFNSTVIIKADLRSAQVYPAR